MKYQFPVKNKFHARTVTELDFEIDPMNPDVYVNLDSVRGKDYIEEIKFNLNVDEDSLKVVTPNFIKIIFSGHRGSGKSIELQRFQNYINDSSRYFSVFIRIEKELEVGSFQPEDLFIILITKLIESIHELKIEFNSDYLKEIQREWLSEKAIIKELKDNFQVDVSSEVAAGASFFCFPQTEKRSKICFFI
jgi:Tfp pilus assembly pilus retraction ATPase PilT